MKKGAEGKLHERIQMKGTREDLKSGWGWRSLSGGALSKHKALGSVFSAGGRRKLVLSSNLPPFSLVCSTSQSRRDYSSCK